MPGAEMTEGQRNALKAYETLGVFLDTDGWHPERLEDGHFFRMGFAGHNGRLVCVAQVRVDVEQLLFYAVAPVRAPEEVRPAVAEFITRANYGLSVGNFEMDFADGEVRYKSALDFEGAELVPALIRAAIYPAVRNMDRFLPGLMKVIYGGAGPEEALAGEKE